MENQDQRLNIHGFNAHRYPTAEEYVPTATFSHDTCLLSPRLNFPPESDLPTKSGMRTFVWKHAPSRAPSRCQTVTPTPPADPVVVPLRSVTPCLFNHHQAKFDKIGHKVRQQKERSQRRRMGGSVSMEETSEESLKYVYKELLGMHKRGVKDYDSVASATEFILESARALVTPPQTPTEKETTEKVKKAHAHPLLTATAGALLLRIADTLTSYKGVVQKLLRVLFSSIYTDFEPEHTEADLIGLQMYSAAASQAEDEANEYLKRVRILTVSQRTCGRVLTQTVGKWQELSLRCIIRSWKAHVMKRKVKSEATAMSIQSSCKRKVKIIHFFRWKAYASKCIQRKFVETSASNSQSLTQWLEDIRAQLAARESEVLKLQDQKGTQRKKNDALFELLSAERDNISSMRANVTVLEGRLVNTADLPLSTVAEIELALSDYDRPPINIFLKNASISAFEPQPGGPAPAQGGDVLAYHVEDAELFFCTLLNHLFPQLKQLSKNNLYTELRSFKHVLSFALLITDTTHIVPDRMGDAERAKWFTMLFSDLGGGKGLTSQHFTHLSDPAWLGLLCVMAQRFSGYNPRKQKHIGQDGTQVGPTAQLPNGRDELLDGNSFKPTGKLFNEHKEKLRRGEFDVSHVAKRRAELIAKVLERKKWNVLGGAIGNHGATLLNRQTAETKDGVRIKIRDQEFKASLHTLGFGNVPSTGVDVVATTKQFSLTLNAEFPLLYRVYLYYRFRTLSLGLEEWVLMCSDARLFSRAVTQEGCEAVFQHVGGGVDPAVGVSFKQFVRAVQLLSFYISQTDKMSHKAKLLTLLAKLANCPQTDTALVCLVTEDERVAETLKAQRDLLRKVFARYASSGVRGVMNLEAVSTFLTAMPLPTAFQEMPVEVLLNTVAFCQLQPQNTDTKLTPSAGLSYKFFTQLVAIMALSNGSNALLPYHQRLSMYLTQHLTAL